MLISFANNMEPDQLFFKYALLSGGLALLGRGGDGAMPNSNFTKPDF